MLWSPKLSPSNIHVRLTAKGLIRNIHLLSGCWKNTLVFQAVDKNKPKTSSWQQLPSSPSKQNHGAPDVVPPCLPENDRNDQRIQNLGKLLAASNCRFEAVAIVLQQTLAERDEEAGQCRELSQELVNLRGELVSSVNSSQRLEKEKQDLQDALDSAMQRMQEQYQKDMEEMEQKLQLFYQAEFYKLQFIYQKEADESKAVLQKQIDQLQVSQDTIKMELQHSHEEQMQSVQQQHDQSMEELRKSFTQQLESSYESFKKADDALKAQVQVLAQENADLMKKQNLAESPVLVFFVVQDSHTVYLEQELESLKVVLDIKNKQIHEQKTMMIEIDKLLEKNVKLDESLKKVQQENEDLKARMERYAALSRQWSTENTMLQESLQKESNVNKRLSMEIEELLWKLHNGEAGSPQKLSHSSDTCSVFPLNPR
ncbi:microtubule-associated tumor suppressor 1 homolog A isoform X2 [Corythoichthys intestinalis]|uniref:microtubule-associated tumor suppressor 1 homolog A isoform X2 n=1 Tax=Corythoichthys intestinalis TaxID=161448 RepID=UPI0025A5369E|nr:microtubule-associated tumor suppressor 1 homolog A isoform X2 [Corythoichthys intestinalis]